MTKEAESQKKNSPKFWSNVQAGLVISPLNLDFGLIVNTTAGHSCPEDSITGLTLGSVLFVVVRKKFFLKWKQHWALHKNNTTIFLSHIKSYHITFFAFCDYYLMIFSADSEQDLLCATLGENQKTSSVNSMMSHGLHLKPTLWQINCLFMRSQCRKLCNCCFCMLLFTYVGNLPKKTMHNR